MSGPASPPQLSRQATMLLGAQLNQRKHLIKEHPTTLLAHNASFDIDNKMFNDGQIRKTSIICTIGPKTNSPEAIAQHVEGTVTVRIHVSADGTVRVIGLASGLGYGLDQSALKSAQGIRFNPAKDANGAAIDWEGTVGITFQIS